MPISSELSKYVFLLLPIFPYKKHGASPSLTLPQGVEGSREMLTGASSSRHGQQTGPGVAHLAEQTQPS